MQIIQVGKVYMHHVGTLLKEVSTNQLSADVEVDLIPLLKMAQMVSCTCS